MLTFSLPLPLLIMALVLLLGIVAIGVFGVVVLRQLQSLRLQSEQRLGELGARLRFVESRIERASNVALPAPSARDRLLGPRPSESARAGSASAPWKGSLDHGEPPGGPTLIAIPDLAVQGHEPDSQAETELVQRHSEVWTMSAAGMPAAEIARQTGQPIGQVELIVGLYRRLHFSRGRIEHARSE